MGSNTLLPPEELVTLIGGDFVENGEHFFQLFTQYGGLKPTDRVLDVGSGVGRMAVPLTRYLTTGSYEGFDLHQPSIDWCIENITRQYPNFNFQLADIYNKHYNPAGRYTAAQYVFPFEAGSFDFVMVISVFTHMLPADIENYLAQISRVLKIGGTLFGTFFLVNPEASRLIDARKSTLDLKPAQGYYTVNPDTPEVAIAYDEPYILNLYADHGLEINAPIHYGLWCGRSEFLSYQDIIIATKKPGPLKQAIQASRGQGSHSQPSLLSKAWRVLTERGPVALAQETQQYLRWRFK